MAILVIAEHDNAGLKAVTLNTVTAATRIGGEIHVLVAGAGCAAVAQAAAQLAGVARVKLADATQYADRSPTTGWWPICSRPCPSWRARFPETATKS